MSVPQGEFLVKRTKMWYDKDCRKEADVMSKVQCYECKRTYDYDEDGFCPRCGAFNQPPRARRIDANGNIVYQDGINEKAHAGSFVHQEYHSENRRRAATPLEQSAPRPTIHTTKRSAAKVQSGKKKGMAASIGAIIVWLVFISAIADLLGSLF